MTGIKVGEIYTAANGKMVKIVEYNNGYYYGESVGGLPEEQVRIVYEPDGTTLQSGWSDWAISYSAYVAAKSVPDVVQSIDPLGRHLNTTDRLDKLEAQCTDIFRQLRNMRGLPGTMQETADAQAMFAKTQVSMDERIKTLEEAMEKRFDMANRAPAHTRIDDLYRRFEDISRHLHGGLLGGGTQTAGLAAKLDELLERLDGTDRRVAALKEGVNDVATYVPTVERKLEQHAGLLAASGNSHAAAGKRMAAILDYLGVEFGDYDRHLAAKEGVTPLITRLGNIQDRVSATESVLERIEQQLTSEPPTLTKKLAGDIAALFGCVAGRLERLENYVAARKGLIDLGTGERVEPVRDACAETGVLKPKSLGWLNVNPGESHTGGTFIVLHHTREAADKKASASRLACVEIFEGQGLS